MSYKGREPKICPYCGGTGLSDIFEVMDINTREVVEVSEETWENTTDDEDEAFDNGMRYVRLDREECPYCKGYGIEE